MKRFLVTIILLLATGSAANLAETYDPAPNTKDDTKVWICVSSSAYRYHNNRHCHGLCKCSHTIKEVTLTYAIEKKYTPCKICYKN